jgi:hypothetical protein
MYIKIIMIITKNILNLTICIDENPHGVTYAQGKFGSIPLKDHHFGSIPLLSHLHVGPHESMTCGVHGIYLKFGSFNGIYPIVPMLNALVASLTLLSFIYTPRNCRNGKKIYST